MFPGIGKRIRGLFRRKLKEPDDYCVGIDLGTTKTSVGYIPFSGQSDVELLTFTNDGEKQLPSIVALDRPTTKMMNPSILRTYIGEEILKENWEFVREKESLAQWGIFPRAKLSIGKGEFDPEEFPKALLDKFPEIAPEDIIACLLAEVRNIFKARKKQELLRATITVPASWDPEQRRATKMAAYMAGFKEVVLLEEPVAALLKVVDLNMYKTPTNLMVVDFGGGTCDVAIVTVNNGEIRLRGAGAQNSLGGELVDEILFDDFTTKIKSDEELARHFFSNTEYEQKFREDISNIENNPNVRSSIRRQLENTKREVNRKISRLENFKPQYDKPEDVATKSLEEAIHGMQPTYSMAPQSYNVEIVVGGIIGIYNYKITFDEIDALFRKPCHQLPKSNAPHGSTSDAENMSVIGAFDAILQDVLVSYLPNEHIETVFLAGGSSNLYFVRQRIRKELFSGLEAGAADEKIQAPANREEAVVRGATLFEARRRRGEQIFKSKLFYDLKLEGDESSLIANNTELSLAGIETDPERYKLKITHELPPDKPIRFKMIRAGGAIGQREIYKSLSHNSPILPDQEIVLQFQISSDSIIFVKGRDYISDEEFKPNELYPVLNEEGLQRLIMSFQSKFPRFFQ